MLNQYYKFTAYVHIYNLNIYFVYNDIIICGRYYFHLKIHANLKNKPKNAANCRYT